MSNRFRNRATQGATSTWLLLLCLLAQGRALAGPKQPTELAAGVREAESIVVAVVVGHEYETILDGGSRGPLNPYTTWVSYRVARSIKSPTGKGGLAAGQLVRVPDQTAECEIPSTTVWRRGRNLRLVHRWANTSKTELTSLDEILKQLRKLYPGQVVLFLRRSGHGHAHVGFSLSPQSWSAALEERIRAALRAPSPNHAALVDAALRARP